MNAPLFVLPDVGVDLEMVERSLIEQALMRTAGNQSRAALLLGISRYALRYRMSKFALGPYAPQPPLAELARSA